MNNQKSQTLKSTFHPLTLLEVFLTAALFFSLTLLFLLITVNTARASEITGTMGSGANGPTGSNTAWVVNGVPFSAPPPPPPSGGGNMGGGGGSSYSSGGSGGYLVALTGDANNDRKVDISDFVVLMADWGQTGTGIAADFNKDGKVDILDFVLLMANWTI